MDKYIILNNFRNHEKTEIKIENNADIFILSGKNGEGKTNILEAISMFSGSRGLRYCKAEEITQKGKSAWSSTISIDDGIFTCGYINGRKIYRVCDKNVRNLNDFSKNHYILWMTYDTDRLFVEAPSNRRLFIDMFAHSKFHNHEMTLKTYEKLTKERIKILKQSEGIVNEITNKWLNIIEEKIVHAGIEIARNRIDITRDIELGQNDESNFPKFTNKMSGSLEKLIEFNDVVENYRVELLNRRQKDFFTNSTTMGPNRSDWEVFHVKNNISATKCSAGEQKMIILGVFLCFVKQNIKNDKRSLILLLDDIIAHLDEDHRAILFQHIKALRNYFTENQMKIMIWLSGTDRKLFSEFSDSAVFLEISNGKINHNQQK